MQTTFQRHEIKYLINQRQKERLMKEMAAYMKLDQYGRSSIRNVYYDTTDYRIIRTSLEKPVYKEKLRIRSYKQVESGEGIFLELKRKCDSVVYKRRVCLACEQAMAYLAGKAKLDVMTQITKEIDYFLQFYEKLTPKVFLSYDREAYTGKESGEQLRITFDENILWRGSDLSLEKGIYGESILNEDQILMEIKTADSIPLWLVKVLSQERIMKVSFSKYGNAYLMIMTKEKGEFIYV